MKKNFYLQRQKKLRAIQRHLKNNTYKIDIEKVVEKLLANLN